jgi:hypothetical protein
MTTNNSGHPRHTSREVAPINDLTIISVVRTDALPLGEKPLDTAVFSAHTACMAKAMLPGRAKPLDSWPS